MAGSFQVSTITIMDPSPSKQEPQLAVNVSFQFNPAASAPTSSATENDVRLIAPEEYKEAAQCLAEAFAEDHVARYFVDTPDRAHWSEAQKWDLHVSILEYVTYAHILKGMALTVGPNYGCVALW
ncbi:hypothetical protein B0A49_01834 [Cryomyces minteri]|uniref:Uncharacterized protein n=1 Tax=Cryomyces minteri TaxID=331657 RepID=A0A4V5NH26_9PEZI|nr:hypothetical protein B0A49_01834 [Cryomyces minteri]